MNNDIISKFIDGCSELGLTLSKEQLDQFISYYHMLIEKNKVMNLTAITEFEEVVVKHFLDSIMIFKYVDIPEGASVIDIGTGAGFPGMVLKIVRPDIELTLLDGLNKRLIFLNEVLAQLGLSAQTVHLRAEDGGKNPLYREKFDIATARAVAIILII